MTEVKEPKVKRRAGRPPRADGYPQAFSDDHQEAIRDFLTYFQTEKAQLVAELQKTVAMQPENAGYRNALQAAEQHLNLVRQMAVRSYEKFRARRLINGVLHRHFTGEVVT